MTTKNSNGGMNWAVVTAVGAVMMSMASGFWQLANPRDDIKSVQTSVWQLKNEEIKQLREELEKLRVELRWTYATKEEGKTYREGLERLIARIETKANTLDSEIHSVGFKDAIAQLQSRVIELERALRDAVKTPTPK